jgi:hypothetical protein
MSFNLYFSIIHNCIIKYYLEGKKEIISLVQSVLGSSLGLSNPLSGIDQDIYSSGLFSLEGN